MKVLHVFILFILVLFIVGIWDIKKSFNEYSTNPNYSTINSFYGKICGIILSVILLILYLLGYIQINDSYVKW